MPYKLPCHVLRQKSPVFWAFPGCLAHPGFCTPTTNSSLNTIFTIINNKILHFRQRTGRKREDLVVTAMECTDWYVQSQHTQAVITSSTANRVIVLRGCITLMEPFFGKPAHGMMSC